MENAPGMYRAATFYLSIARLQLFSLVYFHLKVSLLCKSQIYSVTRFYLCGGVWMWHFLDWSPEAGWSREKKIFSRIQLGETRFFNNDARWMLILQTEWHECTICTLLSKSGTQHRRGACINLNLFFPLKKTKRKRSISCKKLSHSRVPKNVAHFLWVIKGRKRADRYIKNLKRMCQKLYYTFSSCCFAPPNFWYRLPNFSRLKK